LGLRLRELVRAVLGEPLGGVRRRQPPRGIDAERGGDLVPGEHVPGPLRGRSLLGGGHVVVSSFSVSRPAASSVTTVPALPATSAGVSWIEPMTARLPVRSTNSHAARTFGPIEPSAKPCLASAAGVARRIARCRGVPHSAYAASTSVTMT